MLKTAVARRLARDFISAAHISLRTHIQRMHITRREHATSFLRAPFPQ